MNKTMEWQGVTQASSYNTDINAYLTKMTQYLKQSAWESLFDMLRDEPEYVNFYNPSEDSWYTPLHQVAEAGADENIVRELIEMGAWRTLQTAKGERSIDIAVRKSHTHLFNILEPVLYYSIPHNTLNHMQEKFHKYIIRRTESLVAEYQLRLPELETLIEIKDTKVWFPVPGMMGGFSYWLEHRGKELVLVSDNWSRMDGTIYHYEISTDGDETESNDEE